MTALRETCNSWIGNSVAQPALVAMMAAQLPILTKSSTFSGGLTPFSFVSQKSQMSAMRWMLRSSDDLVISRSRSGKNDGILARLTSFIPVLMVL